MSDYIYAAYVHKVVWRARESARSEIFMTIEKGVEERERADRPCDKHGSALCAAGTTEERREDVGNGGGGRRTKQDPRTRSCLCKLSCTASTWKRRPRASSRGSGRTSFLHVKTSLRHR